MAVDIITVIFVIFALITLVILLTFVCKYKSCKLLRSYGQLDELEIVAPCKPRNDVVAVYSKSTNSKRDGLSQNSAKTSDFKNHEDIRMHTQNNIVSNYGSDSVGLDFDDQMEELQSQTLQEKHVKVLLKKSHKPEDLTITDASQSQADHISF